MEAMSNGIGQGEIGMGVIVNCGEGTTGSISNRVI